MADEKKAYNFNLHKIAFIIVIILLICGGLVYFFKKNDVVEQQPQFVNEKIDDTTPFTDDYFLHADPSVYRLARKIERKETITQVEVKALPEGTLNKRYDSDITLLFLALTARNLQAIDVLLASGSDPYMFDQSEGSARDFTYHTATVTMVTPEGEYDPEASKKFRYELTKIYLKNGGKADHIIPGVTPLSLLYMHALKRNYDTVRLLIDSGADPLWIATTRNSAIASLALSYNDEGLEMLKYIICKGFYKKATYEQVDFAMSRFAPSGPRDLEREQILRTLSMIILQENPEFKDNRNTEEIFGGPIPWKEIHELKINAVCAQ